RFREPHAVFSAVQRAVRQTLLAYQPTPGLQFASAPPSEFDSAHSPTNHGATLVPSAQLALEVQRTHSLRPPSPWADGASATDGAQVLVQPQREGVPSAARSDSEREPLPMLRVLGQVARTYIIAEGPEGIFLIDQHAAHERVLYEQFMAERMDSTSQAQALLEPLTLELTPTQAARLDAAHELLRSVGFDIDPFGGTTYLLRAVPSMIADADPRRALVIMLDEMGIEADARGDASETLRAQRESLLIASVCKQAAIKAGRLMNLPEMQALVQQLERSESPRTCPHGRPTMIRLGLDVLARQFGRG
ncbi:MAG: hypothetical protein LC737_11640, partial [Chloroflexi bacterium]|nr:hypothetical protein [Chloroflexota bacterium]